MLNYANTSRMCLDYAISNNIGLKIRSLSVLEIARASTVEDLENCFVLQDCSFIGMMDKYDDRAFTCNANN